MSAGGSHREHPLPRPTAWPAFVGLGLTLLAAGLSIHVLVAIGGEVVFVVGLWGWIRELRAERDETALDAPELEETGEHRG